MTKEIKTLTILNIGSRDYEIASAMKGKEVVAHPPYDGSPERAGFTFKSEEAHRKFRERVRNHQTQRGSVFEK